MLRKPVNADIHCVGKIIKFSRHGELANWRTGELNLRKPDLEMAKNFFSQIIQSS
jgi:hypothetical protein